MFFKKFLKILGRCHSIWCRSFPISFTNNLRMVPWARRKNCGFQVFFPVFSQYDFQNVYVIPHLPNFNFLYLKNKNAINKNFRKNLLHIQKTTTKNFCTTTLLKLKLLEIFYTENTPARVRKSFWNEKIPRNRCQDIVPNVIIPNAKISNAKISNAIIPNVIYNGILN